ncbi:MAG: hypothetical protein R3250_06015 [Melioribacteraceae bacterium]|nr:hypothetical protein [Melioribacteraceae bacterium]
MGEQFYCKTCKRKVNRFLVEGKYVSTEYMTDIMFQVMNKFEDNTPVCFGVTSATAEKFKIFNLGYWFNKCNEKCLELQETICYECRSMVPVWGQGFIVSKTPTGSVIRDERTTDKRKDAKDTDSIHKQREGSGGKSVRNAHGSKGSSRVRSSDGKTKSV